VLPERMIVVYRGLITFEDLKQLVCLNILFATRNIIVLALSRLLENFTNIIQKMIKVSRCESGEKFFQGEVLDGR
jgi:hypothetical protein